MHGSPCKTVPTDLRHCRGALWVQGIRENTTVMARGPGAYVAITTQNKGKRRGHPHQDLGKAGLQGLSMTHAEPKGREHARVPHRGGRLRTKGRRGSGGSLAADTRPGRQKGAQRKVNIRRATTGMAPTNQRKNHTHRPQSEPQRSPFKKKKKTNPKPDICHNHDTWSFLVLIKAEKHTEKVIWETAEWGTGSDGVWT